MTENTKDKIVGCLGCLLYGLFISGITFLGVYVITLFVKMSIQLIG